MDYGDEILTLVEIDQPFCTLAYGTSPCQAQLGVTGTKKCYNTRQTCQDAQNYDPLDITLKFSYSQENIQIYGPVIPSLVGVNTTPLRVNIGAMDPDMGAFGERETVRLEFMDHKHSDLGVDKYRKERPDAHGQTGVEGFDPYENGSFWGKWLARNPFFEGYPVRIKEGRMGDSESALRVRHYLIDKIDGPTNGKISITCKDLFSLIESRKAEAPVANTGELNAGISAGAGSCVLTPSGIGDLEYGNSGYVSIGSEIASYTRATGSDTLTLTGRGVLNTTAAAHDQEDKVQEVLEYNAQRVDDIISDLLVNFTEVSANNIPTSEWSVEASNNLPTLYTAYIPKPTPVVDLVAELAEQTGITLWPDVETDLIEMKAVGVNIVPVVSVDDDAWIIEDSIAIKRDPDQRVSRVQVFYGQINPLEDLESEKNYRSQVEARDVDAEDPTQYGTKSIRKIFSRWIPQFGRATATTLSSLVLRLFRDPPFRVNYKLDIQRAGQIFIATPFSLKTRSLVNDCGLVAMNTLLPMEIKRGETSLAIEAQKLNLTEPVAQERIINIDDDVNSVNLRELHDSLYFPAVSGDEVSFIISSGAIVGANKNKFPALTTGEWPTGVILSLEIEAGGFICGNGGKGGDADFSVPGNVDGKPGRLALEVLFPITITNNGVIGGGGGGGAGSEFGAGGGGAGTNNLVNFNQVRGGKAGVGQDPASDGSLQNGGTASNAGKGGNLGQAGQNSSYLDQFGSPTTSFGGIAGVAVDGDSLVTYTPVGDIRGARIN